jgi:hypothetical protein
MHYGAADDETACGKGTYVVNGVQKGDISMKEITDEYMQEMISRTKVYCIVILKAGPKRTMAGAEKIVWEHARRNFSLRAEGELSIVCPVADGSDICGIGIFDADPVKVRLVMDEDPGVKVGIFIYEIHTCKGFPGDFLP